MRETSDNAYHSIFSHQIFEMVKRKMKAIQRDLLRSQGLLTMCASTCCKAFFRSSFGLCRRSQGLDDCADMRHDLCLTVFHFVLLVY